MGVGLESICFFSLILKITFVSILSGLVLFEAALEDLRQSNKETARLVSSAQIDTVKLLRLYKTAIDTVEACVSPIQTRNE